jgi:hypothetical protein
MSNFKWYYYIKNVKNSLKNRHYHRNAPFVAKTENSKKVDFDCFSKKATFCKMVKSGHGALPGQQNMVGRYVVSHFRPDQEISQTPHFCSLRRKK